MVKSARCIWCNTICDGPIAVLPIASHLSYCILRLTESSSLCNNAQLRHLSENFTMSGKRTTIRIVLRVDGIGLVGLIPDSVCDGSSYRNDYNMHPREQRNIKVPVISTGGRAADFTVSSWTQSDFALQSPIQSAQAGDVMDERSRYES